MTWRTLSKFVTSKRHIILLNLLFWLFMCGRVEAFFFGGPETLNFFVFDGGSLCAIDDYV